ncbi:unnamed protein product [Ixodes pacificus]
MTQADCPSTLLLPVFTCARIMVRCEPPKYVTQRSIRTGREHLQYYKCKQITYLKMHARYLVVTGCCGLRLVNRNKNQNRDYWVPNMLCVSRTIPLNRFDFTRGTYSRLASLC